jgi:hypothetical protein
VVQIMAILVAQNVVRLQEGNDELSLSKSSLIAGGSEAFKIRTFVRPHCLRGGITGMMSHLSFE